MAGRRGTGNDGSQVGPLRTDFGASEGGSVQSAGPGLPVRADDACRFEFALACVGGACWGNKRKCQLPPFQLKCVGDDGRREAIDTETVGGRFQIDGPLSEPVEQGRRGVMYE